jgi:biotin operon repressor
MRKIDDTLMLGMLKQDTPQKEIAEYFSCSPAAICKRIKRLSSSPDAILNKHNLTDKEKMFCVEKAKGKNNTQAVLASYETGSMQSAKAIGSQLMARQEIRTVIDELMDSHGLTKDYRIGKLKQHVDNRDPNVSLKALDQSWKLDNSYAPEKHVVELDYNALIIETKQLDIEIKKHEAELKRLEAMGEKDDN